MMIVDLTEFRKLKDMLDDAGIPYEEKVWDSLGDCHQLIYPCDGGGRKSDVVISMFSYGHEDGLLEQMGLLPDALDEDVQGWLDAETVFNRWKDDYYKYI